MSDKESYWRARPGGFAGYYRESSSLGPRQAVHRFLDRRTTVLRSMVGDLGDARVLDVGCGPGIHLRELSPSCRHVAGVDYSERMLSLALEELGGIPFHNWSLQRADAAALPFRDETFDCVISMGLLDYVPSPGAVLTECHRVLRNGGQLIFSAPKRPSAFFFLRSRIGDTIKRLIFDLPPIGNVLGRRELHDLVATAGFEGRAVVSVWTTMWIVKARKPSAA